MLLISDEVLNSFGDIIVLRDPAGRSVYRSLHRVRVKNPDGSYGLGVAITGSFLLHQLYRVNREQGIRFVEATGDENPIHREGDIVPGAMTAAKAIATLETLLPALGILNFKMKFTSIARYGRPTRQQLTFCFQDRHQLLLRVRIDQEGTEVAQGTIRAKIHNSALRRSVPKRKVNKEELIKVQEFFRALCIPPSLYFEVDGSTYYAYPRAFLASLPSGEMVRRLSGQGGYLTTLELNFPQGPPPPISSVGRPEVSLETAQRRPTFMKVLTQIKQGVEEYCKGFALVFSPQPSTA